MTEVLTGQSKARGGIQQTLGEGQNKCQRRPSINIASDTELSPCDIFGQLRSVYRHGSAPL
jgi:hypothetical protein